MQAIILAGGLGQRLYPLTKDIPKWLLEIGSATIANYQLDWLKRNDIESVLVTLSKGFVNTAKSRPYNDGIDISFVPEERPVGDEGGLKRALEYINGSEVYVVNCDVLTDLPLKMIPAPGIALVHPRAPWGVYYDDGVFEEYPILPIWVSAGIYKFPRAIRDELVDEGKLANNIVPKLIKEGRMSFFKYSGRWRSIETHKDLKGS